VGTRFSVPTQTALAHPVSCTMGTGSLSWGKAGREWRCPPHLEPRFKKEYSYNSTPPLVLRGLFYRTKFNYYMQKEILKIS